MRTLAYEITKVWDAMSGGHGATPDGVVGAVLAFLGVALGCVLGWSGAIWALRNAPELSPIFAVPVNDRGTVAPGPPIAYWLTWLVPPAVLYPAGALLWWRWRPCGGLATGLMTAFTLVFGLLALLWTSMDVGGFSPS